MHLVLVSSCRNFYGMLSVRQHGRLIDSVLIYHFVVIESRFEILARAAVDRNVCFVSGADPAVKFYLIADKCKFGIVALAGGAVQGPLVRFRIIRYRLPMLSGVDETVFALGYRIVDSSH
mgnify:CR=1 FL=1